MDFAAAGTTAPHGRAIGHDQSQADPGRFSASRQGDLNIVKIGQARYEIPDALPFGR